MLIRTSRESASHLAGSLSHLPGHADSAGSRKASTEGIHQAHRAGRPGWVIRERKSPVRRFSAAMCVRRER